MLLPFSFQDLHLCIQKVTGTVVTPQSGYCWGTSILVLPHFQTMAPGMVSSPTPCGSHSHAESMQIRSTPLLWDISLACPQSRRDLKEKKSWFQSHLEWDNAITWTEASEICCAARTSSTGTGGLPFHPTPWYALEKEIGTIGCSGCPHDNASWIPQTILIRKK